MHNKIFFFFFFLQNQHTNLGHKLALACVARAADVVEDGAGGIQEPVALADPILLGKERV